ncbi:MAG: outer membrane beta-barrel protein [Pseudomonadota bacterium]|nr:outer membrane beta-barrel protein [Pseudomonadota bacterium]
MKKMILPALAALAFATPALANEARVEARGGVFSIAGASEGFGGIAAGYDFDLGESGPFVGVEVSGDKIFTNDTKVVFGATGRIGYRVGGGDERATRLFVAGGYSSKPCDLCEDSFHLGGGIQQGVSGPVYVKFEYRHFLVNGGLPDADAFSLGVGARF